MQDEEDFNLDAYLDETCTDEWLLAWNDATRFLSDSKSHAIGCLIALVNRYRREKKAQAEVIEAIAKDVENGVIFQNLPQTIRNVLNVRD